ncbi:MAG: TIGR04283 family arsenosugar biosynthesis glycosyltransferase [Pirellulales bacterium]
MSERLIVFTRYPEPGKSKTRLIGVLGPEGAAQVQREMTQHVLGWAKALIQSRPVDLEICFEGGDESLMRQAFGNDLAYRRQSAGDLGRRMRVAFQSAFRSGSHRVVLVGTDCPELDGHSVQAAFDRLNEHELVLGPATDGGYYLIGLRSPAPTLFDGIPWGMGDVLEATLSAAEAAGLSVALLPWLSDVDCPEDLAVWNRVKDRRLASDASQRISIIIPTLNEAACLGRTLEALHGTTCVEAIVVDAGSHDGTPQIAEAHGCRALTVPPGRAGQMNAGAAAATGSILLFLHADTWLPQRFEEHIHATLARPGVVAGAFRLSIENSRGTLRLIQWAANLRARWLQMPYGDQAIFLTAETFHAMDGFPNLPIMEDFEMVRRLRRRGRITIADASVTNSARRWNALGPLRTTWINQMVVLGYYLGVAPERLARWYRRSEDRHGMADLSIEDVLLNQRCHQESRDSPANDLH